MAILSPQEHESLMHDAAQKGDWDGAIAHARRVPKAWSPFDKLPQYKIPPHAIDKVLDASPRDDRANLLFEVASNLHPDLTGPQLNKISALAGEDAYVNKAVREHPNYSKDVEGHEGEYAASEFWRSYERSVSPHHFAAIKSMLSGKPETVSHRDKEGSSHGSSYIREGRLFDDKKSLIHLPEDFSKYKAYGYKTEAVIPHLPAHARKVQDRILKDPDIEKKYINGKPHVKVYRGIAGSYADKVAKAAGYDKNTHTVKDKELKISALPFHSWSLSRNVAEGFADRELPVEASGEHKAILSTWVPIDHVLHSGFHTVHPSQQHAHPHEQELVVAHPSGSFSVQTSEMEFGHKDQQISKPNTVKIKNTLNIPKKLAASEESKKKLTKLKRADEINNVKLKAGIAQEIKTVASPIAAKKIAMRNLEINSNHYGNIQRSGVKTPSYLMKNPKFKPISKFIAKAYKDEDLWQIKGRHQPGFARDVDHSAHIKENPAPENYVKAVEDMSIKMPNLEEEGKEGISPKLVTKVPKAFDNEGKPAGGSHTVMIKPYHKATEPGTETYSPHPIHGWATLTTKGLFNAAGIGSLSEKVSGHHVQGLPVTVHHFEENHMPLKFSNKEMGTIPVDARQAHKIAVIDFLSNNLDRHAGNMALEKIPNQEGYHNLVGIDHDRNFQYQRSLNFMEMPHYRRKLASPEKHAEEHLSDYENQGAMVKLWNAPFIMHDINDPAVYSSTANWWHENKDKIQQAMDHNLNHIKNEELKNHISKNFLDRMNYMNEWAKQVKANPSVKPKVKPVTITPAPGQLHAPISEQEMVAPTDVA